MNWIIKNQKSRALVKKNEVKKYVLKSLLYNNNSIYIFKLYFDKMFKHLSYKSSISKIRNYCIILKIVDLFLENLNYQDIK